MHTEYRLNRLIDLSQDTRKPLTKRLTFTCVDVGNYIVFGASSGSLYIFRRSPCEFLQLIQNTHGSITNVRISPNERFIGFTTDKGTIGVYSLNFDAKEPIVVISQSEDTKNVTCLEWKNDDQHLFVGNKKGTVCIVFLDMLFNRTLTSIRINPILFLESPIVQISNFDRLLLVSTYARCILCDMQTEQFKQIGNTPRDGYYGACFLPIYNQYSEAFLKIYCARPGSRIWEADLNGNVLQTSQFKTALACIPPATFRSTNTRLDDHSKQPQILQLAYLQPILKKFILGFTRNGFYIFDPNDSRVILWSDEFKDIKDVRVTNTRDNTLHIFTMNGELFSVDLIPLEEQFLNILQDRQYERILCLIFANKEYLREKLIGYRLKLKQIYEFLKNVGDVAMIMELENNFDDILITNEEHNSVHATRLENGIFIVNPADIDEILPALAQTLRINDDIHNNEKVKPSSIHHIDRFESSPEDVNDFDTIISNRHRTVSAIVHQPPKPVITNEEKQLQNLFMICKSQSISGMTGIDRYASIFDELDCSGIQVLLGKVEVLLKENGETESDAKRECFEMYFNYLMPNVISEMDDSCLEYVMDGLILVNKQLSESTKRCQQCNFPTLIQCKVYKYEDLAVGWLKMMWRRGARERCINLINSIPLIIIDLIQLMLKDNDVDSMQVIRLAFASQSQALLTKIMNKYNDDAKLVSVFQLMISMHFNQTVECYKCSMISSVQFDDNQMYSWVEFLDLLINVAGVKVALDLLCRHAKLMTRDVVPKEFYLKCIADC